MESERKLTLEECMWTGSCYDVPTKTEGKPSAKRTLVIFVPGLMGLKYFRPLRYLSRFVPQLKVPLPLADWGHYSLLEWMAKELPTTLMDKVTNKVNPAVSILPYKYCDETQKRSIVPGTYFSSSHGANIARHLAATIKKSLEDDCIEHIYLVGHSFGCLLIRAALLRLHFSEKSAPDFNKLNRIIMLAGTNRGFTADVGRTLFEQVSFKVLRWLSEMCNRKRVEDPQTPGFFGRLALTGLRGSDWTTYIRFNWTQFDEDHPPPKTIMLYGGLDRLANPDDGLEMKRCGNVHVMDTIRGAKHLYFLLGSPEPAASDNKQVKEKLREATINTIKDQIKEAFQLPILEKPSSRKSNLLVAFLVHGIRDYAFWFEALGSKVQDAARSTSDANAGERNQKESARQDDVQDQDVEIVPVHYGYFNAFQFLFSSQRGRCVDILTERYLNTAIQAKLNYKTVTFVVAAHRNGTYVLGETLRKNRWIQFKRIYLAGSVLPNGYRWDEISKRSKERESGPVPVDLFVRNDCANQDLPVAVLSFWAGWIPWNWGRLGSAGYCGFDVTRRLACATGVTATPTEFGVVNNPWLDGNHGVGIAPDNHDQIAKFLSSCNSLESPTLHSTEAKHDNCRPFFIGIPCFLVPCAGIAAMMGFYIASGARGTAAAILAIGLVWVLSRL